MPIFPLEHYKSNVEIIDTYGIKDEEVRRNMSCRVKHINIINRRKERILDTEEYIQPLAAAVLGVNNTALESHPKVCRSPEKCDTWTNLDEQKLYLDSKPVCYVIICKPGMKAYTFGEEIAKEMKCVHICPRNVIIDEIEQNGQTGKCIDFNLKHFRECKIDTIMSIIKQKLQSPIVQHRGYVLSGLPLVSCRSSDISFYRKFYPEDAVNVVDEILNELIITLKKKKNKPKSSGTSISSPAGEMTPEEAPEEEEEHALEEAEEEEDPAVELPKYLFEPCKDAIHSTRNYYDSHKLNLITQLNEMLKLDLRPDIFVYVTSPDAPLIWIRHQKYLNYTTSSNFVLSLIKPKPIETKWPDKYSLRDFEIPVGNDTIIPKYAVKAPINFLRHQTEQLCNYRKHVLPFWEKKNKDINPKYIIRIDGRTSIQEMFYHFKERLVLIFLTKHVLIPEPLSMEEPPEDLEEFWKIVENTKIIQSGDFSFNRYASPWYNRCPVELKKRHCVMGKLKYAMSLFDHVYLLSSLDNLIAFYKNPRPYLSLLDLEPTCRIIVMGTKSSGKTMISECLSWIFDSPIISFVSIYEYEKQKSYDSLVHSLLEELTTNIEETRFQQWQKEESTRISMLETWHNTALTNLKKYTMLLGEYIRLQKEQGEVNQAARITKNLNDLKEQLAFLPFLDDIEQCRNALASKSVIEYAPAKLTIAPELPKIPALGDPDVEEAISEYITANDLQQSYDPTPEEIMNIIVKMIQSIDKQSQNDNSCYGKFIIDGLPPDPEYWTYLTDSNLLPDYTIVVTENREIDQHLIQHYMRIEKTVKYHRERFMKANDPLIKIKLDLIKDSKGRESASEPDTGSHVHKIIHDFFSHSLDNLLLNEEDKEQVESEKSNILTQSIEKFREDWDSTKLKLEENFKLFIEVEIDTNSDIQMLEEVLLRLRKCYSQPCEPFENEEAVESEEQEEEARKDFLYYNDPRFLCETGIFCPVSFSDYGVLWQGKPEFCIKRENKMHYFAKEECLEAYRKDYMKYQSYNKPYKHIPCWRICVIGGVGSGKTRVSKFIAKELGLMHVDFEDAINNFILPKHFKKVGRRYENIFTDISLDEEAVVEFQMGEENENFISDITYNETELRRILYNYLERGAPLLSILMQKIIKKLWFEEPFVTTGFVLDGYPKNPADIEDMVTCFCIPDLVVELESSSEVALSRVVPEMLATWKIQQKEAKAIAQKKYDQERKAWGEFVTREVVVKLIIDEVLTNVVSMAAADDDEPPVVTSVQSTLMDADPSGSPDVDTNLVNIYNEMVEENPAPVDQSEWEKTEDARERIEGRIEAIYESDEENIQALKDLLSEQKIKCVSVDATHSFNKVVRNVLMKLSPLRNRCGFFEQTFLINVDVANDLLSKGMYFLSRFSRMGPVAIYENPNIILNLYNTLKRNNLLFAVIHRNYIYFIQGEENVRKFRKTPLKYITAKNIDSFHEFPLRIGVIGPPKSGKSTLAARLAQHYGLTCVSKGSAVRYVMENMSWTKLAKEMTKIMQSGGSIDYRLILKCVCTTLIDYRTYSQGFVLDGVPEIPPDIMQLESNSIYPLVIFDIHSNKAKVQDNASNEIYYDILKYVPPYPNAYIEYRYSKWVDRANWIRDYINNDCQNIYTVDGTLSKWQCYQEAIRYIRGIVPKIHFFAANSRSTTVVLPVDIMCIPSDVFRLRCTAFKNFCPVCLKKKYLRHSQQPVDRKGVIQYQGLFYWVCPEHMEVVTKDPEKYLIANKVTIPEVPAIVKTFNVKCVYENGICIVTYAENLPAQIMNPGTNKYAATYRKKVYLFCSEECLSKFLARPHLYYDITVFKKTTSFPDINMKSLPDIGYLEQTVGDILTRACCAVNVIRPKYPGLDVQLSALLYIALFLKINNPLLNKSYYPLYKKAFDVYEARSKFILALGLRLRTNDNPFVRYPQCCDDDVLYSGTVCKTSPLSSKTDSLNEPVFKTAREMEDDY